MTALRCGGGGGDKPHALIASTGDVSHCLNAGGMGRIDYETETMIAHALRGEGHNQSHQNAGGHAAVAFQDRFRGDDGRGYDRAPPVSVEVVGALETVKPWNLATPWAVRRLTPVECERLQGFPDDFTRIPYRGKPADRCPDGPRYKALGNSMAVNVMAWIGERIALVDAMEEGE